MNEIKVPERAGLKGRITVREHPAGTVGRMERLIAAGNRSEAMAMAMGGRVAVDRDNLIMQSAGRGMDLIIQRLCSSNSYSLNITYGEIGTGSTVATIADTALTAPVARVATALAQDSGNSEAILQFFFPDSGLANDTFYEFGTFVDGSISLGSGQIFNHGLFGTGYTKGTGTDVTVQVTFTITQ